MANEFFPVDRKQLEHLSNFVIRTETREIKCHKFKLALHSEVFNKMFQHDCNENRKNEVLIDDFEDDTVADFVDFLYQGKLEEESKYTHQLLSIGHKYQVQALVDTCSVYLQSHVTKENVAQVWLVSEAYVIPDLIGSVHDFLARNWVSKDECEGIANVVKSHPEYMMDLFQHFVQAKEKEVREIRYQHASEINDLQVQQQQQLQ